VTQIDYHYAVRGEWAGPPDEKPAVTGAKFLQTLDALSGINPLFSGWQLIRNRKIADDGQPREVPLDTVRERMAEIVETGLSHDEYGEPTPEYMGYAVHATAGTRGPRQVDLSAHTGLQFFELAFGKHNIAADLSIVTYPLFKAALLAISAAWGAKWTYANATRSMHDAVMVPVAFASGTPAFRVDSAIPVPLGPTFPRSIFQVPWIIYLSAQYAAGVTPAREILTERTPDGGLLMSATTERLGPTDPEHARRARILAETLIAQTGISAKDVQKPWLGN
jgi:hypothetical protein